jgi:hypothetical protein
METILNKTRDKNRYFQFVSRFLLNQFGAHKFKVVVRPERLIVF